MTRKVLIVEDEALIALDLKSRIEAAGYLVVGLADSMSEALALVERHSPDIVLMDIRIRGDQDGIETAAFIRRRFDIPVVYVTAYADKETLERAKLTEPFGYIMKPLVNVDFHAQVETVVWKHAMERRLRISEAWLSATLRNVADAIIAADGQGNVAFMNPPAERLTGWNWKAARGQPLLEVLAAFDERTGLPLINPLESLYDGRELDPSPRVVRLAGKDATQSLLAEIHVSANRENGRLLGVIVSLRDVTERRRLEEESKQVQKMHAISSLSGGLSRDLDRKLELISLSIRAMRAESMSTPASETLNDIDRACRRAQSLVLQLRLLARSDFELQSIDLEQAMAGLSARIEKKLGRKRTLKLTLAPDLPPIRADQTAFDEAILNLISEARETMPEGGVVEIQAKSVPSAAAPACRSVQLVVKDSGSSQRQAPAKDLFDPYPEPRKGSRSAGLSMTLVYHCVALSGGSVEVKSEPEAGTSFVMTFPAATATT